MWKKRMQAEAIYFGIAWKFLIPLEESTISHRHRQLVEYWHVAKPPSFRTEQKARLLGSIFGDPGMVGSLITIPFSLFPQGRQCFKG